MAIMDIKGVQMLSEQVLRLDTLNLLELGRKPERKGTFIEFPYDSIDESEEDDDLDTNFYRVFGGEA